MEKIAADVAQGHASGGQPSANAQPSLVYLLKRALTEFWIPTVCAIAWTTFSALRASQSTLPSLVAGFAGSFFFIAWGTGQWNRIRKQAQTEGSFRSVEGRLGAITSDLDQIARRLENTITGGPSFCWLQLWSGNGNHFKLVANHHGEYPLTSVSVNIADLEKLDHEAPHAAYTHIELGDLIPGHAVFPEETLESHPFKQDYNAFFTAKNGGWVQEIRGRRVGPHMVFATRVSRDRLDLGNEEDVFYWIPEMFPKIGDSRFDSAPRIPGAS